MITSKELAKLAGVSQSTVSRCLNDSPLISEETKKRVKELAAQHNFGFNVSAKGLKTHKTGVIGYIFSEDFSGFSNHFIQSYLYYEIRNRLVVEGLDVVPVFDEERGDGISNIEQCIRNQRFEGLIFNRPQVSESIEMLLKMAKIPYIFIYDTSEELDYDFMIAPSHKQCGQLAGAAFGKKGCRNIVELMGPKSRIDVVNKHAGFTQALAEYGVSVPKKNLLYSNYRFEATRDLALEQIELFRAADACFAHNDLMALALMEALRQNGVRVPEDLVIIGYDNIPMATWCKPCLTTISIDYSRIISVASEWMLELISGGVYSEKRKILLNSSLVMRDTFQY